MIENLKHVTKKHNSPEGDHHFIACCPVPGHGKGRGDQRPSLHIWHPEGKPNHLRFWCPAGCTTAEIHEALEYTPPKTSGGYQLKELLVGVGEFKTQIHGQWVTAYEEQRFRKPDGSKFCKCRHWDTSNNRWASGAGKPRRFFGLEFCDSHFRRCSPSVEEAEFKTKDNERTVWITEGWHKSVVLHRKDIPALAMDGGSTAKLNTTHFSQLEFLKVSNINIWIDKDEAGRRFGERLRREFSEQGYHVKIWQTHLLESGADAVDHYAQGYDIDDLEEVIDVAISSIGEDLGTDKYIANYLRQRFMGSVIYAEGLPGSWRIWNGKLFTGNHSDVLSTASQILEEHFNELMGRGLTQGQIRNAKRILGLPPIRNALTILQADLTVQFHELGDHAHPELINASNGVIDLRSQKLLPHSPEYKFVQILPVDFVEAAECRRWDAAWSTWFPDSSIGDYMKTMMGTFLIGKPFRGFLQCWGKGRNGKTAFSETIELILGKEGDHEGYGETVPIEVFISNKNAGGDSPNGGWNAMMFKRAVFAEEPSRGMALDDGRIKSLTGGASNKDRRLHQNTKVKWKPQCTLVIATNEKLRINDTSEGMWDRVRFVEFEARIAREQCVDAIWELFYSEESEGILRHMVRAASELLACGMPEPSIPLRITEAVKDYRQQEDILGQFLEENVEDDVGYFETKISMFSRYQDWCRASGHHSMNKNNFGRRLIEERSWPRDERRNGQRVWIDVKIKHTGASHEWPVSAVS